MNSYTNAKQPSIKQILHFSFAFTTSETIERVNSTLIDICSQESDYRCTLIWYSYLVRVHLLSESWLQMSISVLFTLSMVSDVVKANAK